jgi:hypothetical protein
MRLFSDGENLPAIPDPFLCGLAPHLEYSLACLHVVAFKLRLRGSWRLGIRVVGAYNFCAVEALSRGAVPDSQVGL